MSDKQFVYVGLSKAGERVTGEVKAGSEALARSELRKRGVKVLELKSAARADWKSIQVGSGKFTLEDKADFAAQLSLMLEARINVPESLRILGADVKSPTLKNEFTSMANAVEAGQPLSAAMGQYPKHFDSTMRAYVKSGEENGTMAETLASLALMLKGRAEVQRKIKAALTYPKFVMGVALLASIVMLQFVLPQFATQFEQSGTELPAFTQFVLNISSNLPIILLVVVVLVGAWVVFLKKTKNNLKVGERLDKVKFKLPVLGRLFHERALYQWTTTLQAGLLAQVPMFNALERAAQSSGSRWVRAVTPSMQQAVVEGRPLSEVLRANEKLFTGRLCSMVKAGEKAGDTPEMLGHVSESLRGAIDDRASRLAPKMEVVMLVVMGVVIGGLVIAMYLPMFNLVNTQM